MLDSNVSTQMHGIIHKTSSTIVADAHVSECRWFAEVVQMRSSCSQIITVDPNPTLFEISALSKKLAQTGGDDLWVIGGGAVLDMTRLARYMLWNDISDVSKTLTCGRQGFIVLRGKHALNPVIQATPTTLGSGAEASSAACLIVNNHRRLALSSVLQSDYVSYVPEVYATLSDADLARAVLEVVARILGPYIVSSQSSADIAASQALAMCLALRPRVVARERQALISFAKLSGLTHGSIFSVGRSFSSSPLWYLANEASMAAMVTKMVAHEALIGPCVRAVGHFGGGWGSRERLHELLKSSGWCSKRCSKNGIDCALGLVDLLVFDPNVKLQIEAPDVIMRCEQHWGLGLPVLSSVPRDQLEWIFDQVIDSTDGTTKYQEGHSCGTLIH
jgi:hypothetical protein